MCFSCACYVYVTCISGVHGGQRGQSGTEVRVIVSYWSLNLSALSSPRKLFRFWKRQLKILLNMKLF